MTEYQSALVNGSLIDLPSLSVFTPQPQLTHFVVTSHHHPIVDLLLNIQQCTFFGVFEHGLESVEFCLYS